MDRTSRVAQRYARAVMEMAHEEKSVETVIEDFKTIRAAIEGSQDLRNFLMTPIIDAGTKSNILGKIFGDRVGPITARFITLLATKGRSSDLYAVSSAFQVLLDAENKVVVANVTTAVEIDDAQRAAIEQRIAEISGLSVRAEYKVDPELIGGFQARFEDTMIDASLRHQLDRLRDSLMAGSMN